MTSKKSGSKSIFIPSILRLLDMNKCEDIKLYADLHDYFSSNVIVATATSERHCKAIAERISEFCKDNRVGYLSSTSSKKIASNDWVIVDCESELVIVHVMTEEKRGYYNIDELLGSIAAIENDQKKSTKIAPKPVATKPVTSKQVKITQPIASKKVETKKVVKKSLVLQTKNKESVKKPVVNIKKKMQPTPTKNVNVPNIKSAIVSKKVAINKAVKDLPKKVVKKPAIKSVEITKVVKKPVVIKNTEADKKIALTTKNTKIVQKSDINSDKTKPITKNVVNKANIAVKSTVKGKPISISRTKK